MSVWRACRSVHAEADAQRRLRTVQRGRTFYRTGLQDYPETPRLARITLPGDLFLNLSENYLNNKNPDPVRRLPSVPMSNRPACSGCASKRVSYRVHSESGRHQLPGAFPYSTDLSLYVDNANTGSLMAEFTLPAKRGCAEDHFGGSFVTHAGSRPSKYYQPLAKLLIPITPRVHLYAEWQWYELNQPFYLYEGFRAHTILSESGF